MATDPGTAQEAAERAITLDTARAVIESIEPGVWVGVQPNTHAAIAELAVALHEEVAALSAKVEAVQGLRDEWAGVEGVKLFRDAVVADLDAALGLS